MKFMTVLLFAFLFIVCWVLGLITWIRIIIVNKKNKNELTIKAPTIFYSIGLRVNTYSVSKATTDGINLIKMLFSFGGIQNTRNFVNGFADLLKIEEMADIQQKRRIEKLIKLFSLFSKIWILGLVSILLAFLLSLGN